MDQDHISNIPPAEIIEGALDDLKSMPSEVKADLLVELRAAVPTGGNFDDGYLLGLQVAYTRIISRLGLPVPIKKASEIL